MNHRETRATGAIAVPIPVDSPTVMLDNETGTEGRKLHRIRRNGASMALVIGGLCTLAVIGVPASGAPAPARAPVAAELTAAAEGASSGGPAGIAAAGNSTRLDRNGLEADMARLQGVVQRQMKARDWDAALATLEEMAALDVEHPKLYLQVVLLHNRKGTLDEAAGAMDRIGTASGPGRVYGEGLLRYFRKDVDGAAEMFERSLEAYARAAHPAGQAASHSALGNIHKRRKEIDQAVEEYEAARRLLESVDDRQGLIDLLSNLAKLERQRGRPVAAAEQQRRVLVLRRQRHPRSSRRPGM